LHSIIRVYEVRPRKDRRGFAPRHCWIAPITLIALAVIAYFAFRKGKNMTGTQRKQWNQRACIPRCLVKLANNNGNSITDDEFAKQIEYLFPNPKTDYGSFDIGGSFFEILSKLRLPMRREDSSDYSRIEHHFNTENHRCILVMSGINLDPGQTNPGKHCSVLTRINSGHFSVWTPYQDGSDSPLDDLEKSVWTAKECFGVVLF
jgi:hypothetical protein